MIKQPIRAYGAGTNEALRVDFVRENFSLRKLIREMIATSALTTVPQQSQTTTETK
jgi:hypothetical protein